MSGGDEAIRKAVHGVQYLVGLQVGSRVLSFVLNVAITRFVSQEVFGVFSLQHQLLLSLVLFLSREGVRRACLRVSSSQAPPAVQMKQVVNLAWLAVPLGLIIMPCVCFSFVVRATEEELSLPHYYTSIWLYGVGALLELLSEPMYCVGQHLLNYKARMYVETIGVLARCIFTYILAVHFQLGLLSFAFAQMLYGIVLVVGYYVYLVWFAPHATATRFSFMPHLLPGRSYVSYSLLHYTAVFTWQSLQKLVLTEGDKLVLWLSESLVNQSIFSVVNNLGSLVARFLFQPVEEVCANLFARLASADDQANIQKAYRVLRLLLRLMIVTGLFFTCFGPNYSHTLIDILYTSKYSMTAAPMVLAWYCFYVLVIAVNGVTEAFVHNVATQHQLRQLNFWLIAFSVFYVVLAVFLVRICGAGTVGLVWANCANMLMRISFAYWFIRNFFQKHNILPPLSVRSVLPHRRVCIAFACAFVTTYALGKAILPIPPTQSLPALALHTGVGAVFAGIVMLTLYLYEMPLLMEVYDLWRSH